MQTVQANDRHALPQLSGKLFLTDGGLETTLIFHDGIDLPYFAAFDLLKTDEGREALGRYFRSYAEIAARDGVGLILETATWRASKDWGAKLGYTAADLARANRQSVALLEDIRDEFAGVPIVISGCVGPRGDGYNPAFQMTTEEAEAYHAAQVHTFAGTAADLVTAITMTYTEEATGVAQLARAAQIPAVISFTTETDGKLPSGQDLQEAIETVDAATNGYPLYYMLNCAHPEHFQNVLTGDWTERIRGLRANASRMSHAELDEAEELDDGNPDELAAQYNELRAQLKNLNVMGGCCGTDHRHVGAISRACKALA